MEEDEYPSSSTGSEVWYEKIFPVVDDVRKRSMDLIYTLGTHLVLDKQWNGILCYHCPSSWANNIKVQT